MAATDWIVPVGTLLLGYALSQAGDIRRERRQRMQADRRDRLALEERTVLELQDVLSAVKGGTLAYTKAGEHTPATWTELIAEPRSRLDLLTYRVRDAELRAALKEFDNLVEGLRRGKEADRDYATLWLEVAGGEHRAQEQAGRVLLGLWATSP
jgi:hypothetical protein